MAGSRIADSEKTAVARYRLDDVVSAATDTRSAQELLKAVFSMRSLPRLCSERRRSSMMCFAKPVVTEDLYTVNKEEFSITFSMCHTYTWRRASIFIRDKLIFSSERILHRDYDRKGLVAKEKFLVVIVKVLASKPNWR
jgi:hypothetical protein